MLSPIQWRGGNGTGLQQEMVPLGLGTLESCQEGKMCTAGCEETAWEEEMVGAMPVCSPAPGPWDCVHCWSAHWVDPRLRRTVISDDDAPTSLPKRKTPPCFPPDSPYSAGTMLSPVWLAGPHRTGWGDQAGL